MPIVLTPLSFFDTHVALKKAFLLIAYDNGMVNREEPEPETLQKMATAVTDRYTPDQLSQVDTTLAALSDTKLEELCCGEGGGEQWCDDLTDGVLNTAFEHGL